MNPEQRILSSLLMFLLLQSCTSIDTITSNHSISDAGGELLVSSGENFALGFFSPGNSRHRYVGIWYHKISEQTVVWVANRDHPIKNTTAVLSINQAGNLVLHAQEIAVWSSTVSVPSTENCIAQLLDSGNLVLLQSQTKRVIWQSFDYPTDTILPFMKLGLDRKTGLSRILTSWKSRDDPGPGDWSYKFDPNGSPQCVLYKGRVRRWRSGPWYLSRNYERFINDTIVNNGDEISSTYTFFDTSLVSRDVLNESGSIQILTWHEGDGRWIEYWSAPKESCDYYGKCGANGNCNSHDNSAEFECRCLPGYDPKSPRDWSLRNGSGGCVRKRASSCGDGDGFVKVEGVLVPDTSTARVDTGMSRKACEEECLRKCSCTGYTSAIDGEGGVVCLTWYGDLMDIRAISNGIYDFYIRVDSVELAQYAKKSKSFLGKKRGMAILAASTIVTFFLILTFAYWLVKKRKGTEVWPKFLCSVTNSSTPFGDSPRENELGLDESGSNSNLRLFELSTITAATDNFSSANKLGQGGFGFVYKGCLHTGQEIAVKRLSKNSGQGKEEFMNEVMLIAKLQHRNLVRLFGCCIQREERILIYEYLPNKSLDFFIFDETRSTQVDWRKRYEIIFGIARGLLYLHQDSRLKIIHRDLKTSNILLDVAMNPKISDFGMARIFGRDQIEANTKRVVGTYGYMSPEYVVKGLYSIKSDVFSFGIILLEIISGRKNNDYCHEGPFLNLLGHVWDLWREGKALDIVDSSLGESYPTHEVLKCIQIGLLCVQECAVDRPTMSEVVFMLGNEKTLPSPKQSAFILRSDYNSPNMSTAKAIACSVSEVTLTSIEAL